jgi:hypothetical protein
MPKTNIDCGDITISQIDEITRSTITPSSVVDVNGAYSRTLIVTDVNGDELTITLYAATEENLKIKHQE